MEPEIRPLSKFQYLSAGSLSDVIAILEQHGEKARLLAGGTDLLVWIKKRAVLPEIVVDVSRVADLSFVEMNEENLRIGAATTLNTIKESGVVKEKFPFLAEAIGSMSCHPIRNRATMGGNLCSASPAADTAPPLLALDASVLLEGHGGERRIPLAEFFLGPGKTVKKANELMKEIIIPEKRGHSAFLKLGRRKGLTLSVASVAAFVTINKGRFEGVRLAAGAVAPTPLLIERIEKELQEAIVDRESIEHASNIVKEEIDPITDIRASAAYRREMAGVLTRRVLQKLSGMEGQ